MHRSSAGSFFVGAADEEEAEAASLTEAVPEEPEQHRHNAVDLASAQRGGTSEQKHEHVFRLRLRFFLQKSTHSCKHARPHDQLRHPCFG